LAFELELAGIPFEREASVDVWYKGRCIGHYRADFLVASKVVLELKATMLLSDADERQLLNCLRCSRLEVGLLLHFGPKAKYYRTIYTNDRKPDLPKPT
jgi:GxxExxY protein